MATDKTVKRVKISKHDTLVGYSFVLPSLIGFCCFMAFPLFYSLFLSFMDWSMFRGFSGSHFIGLDNFKSVFTNEYFWAGLRNNLLFVLMAVPLLIIISLVVAVFLNGKIYGRGALRAAYFMPYITTVTASAIVFSALFHPEFGPINNLLRAIGISDPPGWAASSKWALFTVALFWIWKNIGYCIVIFLAGLQGINKSLYEAAEIDGANSKQQFFRITVPMVSPTTFFLVITTVITSFQLFAEIQVMTQGGPGTATVTLVYHIYQTAFQEFKMGYASAVSWIFFLLILVVTVLQWKGQKKWVNYD
jgi:multiple sugar transport system permease protein